MLATDDHARLADIYSVLRDKLLDLTRRNRMLSYPLGARSRRSLQIVDTAPNSAYRALVDQSIALDLKALDEPNDTPADERSEDFLEALEHAHNTDIEYLTQVRALESIGRADDYAIAAADIELRTRVRATLGMLPRSTLKEINRNEHARSLGINPNVELPLDSDSKSKRPSGLQTLKFPTELESTLELIAADARLAEQEMGLSTLFLAFGFVEWYASADSDNKAFAPLLLLPVTLDRRKVQGKWRYSVSSPAVSAEVNLSFQRLLDLEFGRKLPEVEASEEESQLSIEEYFARVTSELSGLTRWRVHRWMVLGHFSFGRLAMYADLAPENWKKAPTDHPLLKVVLQGSETVGVEELPPPPQDYNVDDPGIERIAPFLVQDADASQHSALVDAMRGVNLVIQGPPGTGKSQTITNIIANALASNKTVLFLAEKRAALEVVKRRLDRCGLGDFCLELHSDKSSSKQIVQNIRERYELTTNIRAQSARNQVADASWRNTRKHLSEYLNALHTKDDLGEDTFTLMWRAIRGRAGAIENSQPALLGVAPTDLQSYARGLSAIKIFSEAAKRFESNHGPLSGSAWYPLLENSQVSTDDVGPITSAIEISHAAITAIIAELASAPKHGIDSIEDLISLAEIDQLPETLPNPHIIELITTHDPDELDKHLRTRQEILRIDCTLDALGRLEADSPDIFNKAARIATSYESAPELSIPASECYIRAEHYLNVGPAALEALRALAPAVSVLQLPDDFEALGLESVALCAIFAANLKEHQRHWLFRSTNIDAHDFALFDERRSELTKQDEQWRRRFLSYRYLDWPSVDELRNTADYLRQGFPGKALALINNKARRSSQIAQTLELSRGGLGAPETAEKLAAHVKDLRQFWNDPAHQKLFGESWRGPETEFDPIRFRIQYDSFLQIHLMPLKQGKLVSQHFTSLDAASLLALAKYSQAGHYFRSLPLEAQHSFDSVSMSLAESTLSRQISFARDIASADPTRQLSKINRSIQELHQIGELERRRIKLTSEQRGQHPELDSTSEAIEDAFGTIQWVKRVSAAGFSPSIRASLLSQEVITRRDQLFNLRKATRLHVETLDTKLRQIESSYSLRLNDSGLNGIVARTTTLVDRQAELYDTISLKQCETELLELGLGDFVSSALRARIPNDQLTSFFEAYCARQRIDRIKVQTPALKKYNGTIIEAYRSEFAKGDRLKQKNDSDDIRSILKSRIPAAGVNAGPKRDWTEMWLLKNEFEKQARFAPVRSIIRRAPQSLQALKPCFMMSPLSLAKFVSPGEIEFDILVIDEASQMRPEDAFGAFLRSKQVIVVGDTKQLPPTDFFNRAETEDTWDDDDGTEDDPAESVLESCYKSFGQVRQLKWHYRSRCESLIAFSNNEFYNGSLVTFPTARPNSFSVSLIRVEGSYQARRNVAEASRIAEEAIAFMRSFAQRSEADVQSLGIVALNSQQRELIQAELHRLEAGDELVERYREIVAKRGEELFVKNLENIQGDERDFIFISLTYGREPGATALKQRFGPINSKSGHRRLNVLFTRARSRIALFSSFGSTDVLPSAQSNEGVHVLKRYLQYAEQRGRGRTKGIGEEADSDFELEVADRLRREGFEVDLQVGVSGFRIDLGVKHPDHPSIYLAGIECDGARFHSSKSARDRDRLREEVLAGLGWSILRVWSTDWYANADEETRKLARKLDSIRLARPAGDDTYKLKSTYEAKSSTPVFEDAETNDGQFDAGSGGKSQPTETTPLTEEEAVILLERFRENVISKEIDNWERQRSLLRDSMIEAIIKQRVSEPREWVLKIPHYQRSGTSPIEKKRYLEQICQIVRRIKVDSLVALGESGETEFKSTLRTNLATGQRDPKMEFTALRAMASLLNSNGGRLIIGVEDDGNVLGIGPDDFENEDRMSLYFNNLIHTKVGSQHSIHIEIRFEDYDSKRILVINCQRARIPVFVKDAGTEKFFIRNGTSTRELTGSQQLEYIKSRFGP